MPTKVRSLFDAALKGDCTAIDSLICESASINHSDANGNTALHMAASQGHIPAIERLITAHGAKLSDVNNIGCSALHHAALNGHLSAVTHLLNVRGMSLKQKDIAGRTPFLMAVGGGHKHIIDFIVQHDRTTLNDKSISELTALHVAAQAGQISVIDHLVDVYHMKIEDKCPQGMSPLLHAATHGQIAVIDHLLKKYSAKIKITETNIHGITALILAAVSKDAKSPDDQAKTLEQLVKQHGAKIDEKAKGFTALHFAAMSGNYGAVQVLLRLGAYLDAVDANGLTIMQKMNPHGNVFVPCTLLISTALQFLEQSRQRECENVKVPNLLDGCVNGRSIVDGNTALHHAVMGCNYKLIRALLEAKADFSLPNKEGLSALDLANKSTDCVVQFLLNCAILKQLSLERQNCLNIQKALASRDVDEKSADEEEALQRAEFSKQVAKEMDSFRLCAKQASKVVQLYRLAKLEGLEQKKANDALVSVLAEIGYKPDNFPMLDWSSMKARLLQSQAALETALATSASSSAALSASACVSSSSSCSSSTSALTPAYSSSSMSSSSSSSSMSSSSSASASNVVQALELFGNLILH